MNIAIDNGYYSTVVYPNISFRSKIQLSPIPIQYHNTHHIIIDSKSYLVGNGAEEIDINLNKSNSLLHYLTTITGLGLLGSGSYNLVANLPLNFFNKSNKLSFENHLTTDVSFTLDSKPCSISIKCIVFPQVLPVLYVNSSPSLVAVLDIGGLTAQGCVCENLNIIQSSIFSANLGTLVLFNKIKKSLNSIFNLNLQDYELENIIKHGLPNKNSSSIINDICISHVQQILQSMKLSGWNIESLPILLTGGGSLFLETYLSKVLPQYKMSNEPLLDNVKGLMEVANHVFKA